jgi:YD repeat-containing protein
MLHSRSPSTPPTSCAHRHAHGGVPADTYVYDALGRRIQHTNALRWVDKTYYNSLGRVVRSVSAGGRETTYTYAFVAAGTVASSGGIISAGGANLGGWQLTTLGADGRKTVDRSDYFGRTTWHQDQGSRTYVYSYDFAGRLSSQTSSTGQNIQYGYYANGFIKEARDLANRMMSRYGYDNAGNRIWEMYSGLDAGGTAPVGLYQDSKITYDELGRMGHIADVSYDIQYEYDAVGNRRSVRATYLDPLWNDVRRREDFWYTYDGANRFTLTKGTLEGGRRGTSLTDGTARIVQGAFGVALTYNGVGRRTSARYADNSFEEYFYSTDGFLEDTYITPDAGLRKLRARRRVDSTGRTLQYKEYDSAGGLAKTTDSVYDRDNRMLSSKDGAKQTEPAPLV